MQPIQGHHVRIVLFEGSLKEVMLATNRWLEGGGEMFEIMDIAFNYQGPEYDGAKKLTDRGTHGVLFAIKPLDINEVRRRRGLAPIILEQQQEEHHGTEEADKGPPNSAFCM